MASLSGSILTPSFGFSMHQLIMSRSVENLLICSWNFGNSWGCVSDVNGWHMAQAIPVLDSVTFIFFSVSPSPLNRRSPTFTCSMKTSWNALSCSGVCFSLWARAVGGASVRPVPRTTKSSPATEAPSAIRTRRFTFMTIPPTGGPPAWTRLVGVEAVGDARAQNLVDVVARPRVDRRIGDDRLPPPHDVLVLDLRGSGRREAPGSSAW